MSSYAQIIEREYSSWSFLVFAILRTAMSIPLLTHFATFSPNKKGYIVFLTAVILWMLTTILIWCTWLAKLEHKFLWVTKYLAPRTVFVQNAYPITWQLTLFMTIITYLRVGECDSNDNLPYQPCAAGHREHGSVPAFLVLALTVVPIISKSLIEQTKIQTSFTTGLIGSATIITAGVWMKSTKVIALSILYTVSMGFILCDSCRKYSRLLALAKQVEASQEANSKRKEEQQTQELRVIIGNVAHDLKTPLTSILNGVEYIQDIVSSISSGDSDEESNLGSPVNGSRRHTSPSLKLKQEQEATQAKAHAKAKAQPVLYPEQQQADSVMRDASSRLAQPPIVKKAGAETKDGGGGGGGTEKGGGGEQEEHNAEHSSNTVAEDGNRNDSNADIAIASNDSQQHQFEKAGVENRGNEGISTSAGTSSLMSLASKPIIPAIDTSAAAATTAADEQNRWAKRDIQKKKNDLANLSSILDCLKDMSTTGNLMTATIMRCVEFTKVNTGLLLNPYPETVSLQEVCAVPIRVINDFHKKVDVHVQPWSAGICSYIITDRQWLIQNLMCLLSNAVRYSSNRGRVDIHVELDIGNEESDKTSYFLRFEVQDTGIGLSDEAMQSLFNPFIQAQRLAGGTGLGLFSLAKRIEALQGKYGVHRRTDNQQGSVFWFTIPYHPDEVAAKANSRTLSQKNRDDVDSDEEKNDVVGDLIIKPKRRKTSNHNMNYVGSANRYRVHPSASPTSGGRIHPSPMLPHSMGNRGGSGSGGGAGGSSSNGSKCSSNNRKSGGFGPEFKLKRLHVLIVDDAPTIQKMTKMLLTRKGHIVQIAENGVEGLEKIAVNHYDVVLMDLQMPVMDGIEAIRRLRDQEINRQWEVLNGSDTGSTVPLLSNLPTDIETGPSVAGTLSAQLSARSESSSGRISDSSSNLSARGSRSHLPTVITSKEHQFIIALSANSDEDTIEEAIDAGADVFISKPFSYGNFTEAVGQYLHKQKQQP